MLAPAFLLLPIALQAAAPVEDLTVLHQRMEVVAGAPLRPLDPRLRLSACPIAVAIAMDRGSAVASCPARGWRVYAPVLGGSAAAAAAPVIRRGDAVAVRLPGRGFAVTLRAVALEDGAVGNRIRLRAASGPARPMTATVTAAGEAAP
jgi:flagellar basal body P-ring formation protein FlgA